MRWRRVFSKKQLGIGLALGGLIMIMTPAMVANRTWGIRHPDLKPQAFPGEPALEEQVEDFTCGTHALSTVYKAYGLHPQAERIRERLGTDTKALFYLKESKGTFHPDIYMVAAQDYFSLAVVDLSAQNAWEALQNHLKAQHLAILLIMRRETSGLHWVVARHHSPSHIEVFDSLKSSPALEQEDYLQNQVLSAILIKPSTPWDPALTSLAAHTRGSAELQRSMHRYSQFRKFTLN